MNAVDPGFWRRELRPFHPITSFYHDRGAGAAAIALLAKVLGLPADWQNDEKASQLRTDLGVAEDICDVWLLDRLFDMLIKGEIQADERFDRAVLVFLSRVIQKELGR